MRPGSGWLLGITPQSTGGKAQWIPETALVLMRNPYSTAPKLSTRRVITGFAPPEQRTAEQAAVGLLWGPWAATASRLRVRLHETVSQVKSMLRRYSLFTGACWGGRETAGYRVSCPWCNAGTVRATARSFLLVRRDPGAPVIICGAAAHIRLN